MSELEEFRLFLHTLWEIFLCFWERKKDRAIARTLAAHLMHQGIDDISTAAAKAVLNRLPNFKPTAEQVAAAVEAAIQRDEIQVIRMGEETHLI